MPRNLEAKKRNVILQKSWTINNTMLLREDAEILAWLKMVWNLYVKSQTEICKIMSGLDRKKKCGGLFH